MQNIDANRLKLWQALATLFLDTEITDSDFDYIARIVLETGHSANGGARHSVEGSGQVAREIARCWDQLAARLLTTRPWAKR